MMGHTVDFEEVQIGAWQPPSAEGAEAAAKALAEAAAKPKFVSKEDRLEAENIQLRLTVLQSKKREVVHVMQELEREEEKVRSELDNKRHEIEKKYGVNLLQYEMRAETGELVPREVPIKPPVG